MKKNASQCPICKGSDLGKFREIMRLLTQYLNAPNSFRQLSKIMRITKTLAIVAALALGLAAFAGTTLTQEAAARIAVN
jgi:hypothetical protein